MRPNMVAAKWVARMQRPDAARFQQEFDAWLAQSPENRHAYDKAASRFSSARRLSGSSRWPKGGHKFRSWRPRTIMVAASFGLFGMIAVWTALSSRPGEVLAPFMQGDSDDRNFDLALNNAHGAIVHQKLADGSSTTLDADTVARFSFKHDVRAIWLAKGRARFTVSHDGRPFIVHAGNTTIRATGTVFDVARLDGGAVRVALLQGSIEVQDERTPTVAPHMLTPGQVLDLVPSNPTIARTRLDRRDSIWPQGLMEFDAATLAEVVAAANRYGRMRIRIEDTALSQTRISGRFRIDASERLAINLAKSLGLTVTHDQQGDIVLRH
jgi:transmembrane sensor